MHVPLQHPPSYCYKLPVVFRSSKNGLVVDFTSSKSEFPYVSEIPPTRLSGLANAYRPPSLKISPYLNLMLSLSAKSTQSNSLFLVAPKNSRNPARAPNRFRHSATSPTISESNATPRPSPYMSQRRLALYTKCGSVSVKVQVVRVVCVEGTVPLSSESEIFCIRSSIAPPKSLVQVKFPAFSSLVGLVKLMKEVTGSNMDCGSMAKLGAVRLAGTVMLPARGISDLI